MPIDDWKRAAAADDKLVAELLLGLKHSGESFTPMRKSDSLSGGLATFRWGRRKARSSHGVTRFVMEKECTKRASRSPTTPLSWSGGTSASASGNADGYEACSRPSRSKNYVEFKEEEGWRLQDRQTLKRHLATLHSTTTHHQITNKNLKKTKRVNAQSKRINTSNVVDASTLQHLPSPFTPQIVKYSFPPRPQAFSSFDDDQASASTTSATKCGDSFLLPDLNMLPSIDEEHW